MSFGVWFEYDKPEIMDSETWLRMTSLVCKASKTLAPHFGFKNRGMGVWWKKNGFPKVAVGKENYDYHTGTIHLPVNIPETDYGVGHETGHWFNDCLNPDTFRLGYTFPHRSEERDDFYVWVECVARFAGMLYMGGSYTPRNPPFKLAELATMHLGDIKAEISKIRNFYCEMNRQEIWVEVLKN